MPRLDVHSHFLPAVDDGCRDVGESLICLRQMADAGYTRVFCTPHSGPSGLTCAQVAAGVAALQKAVDEVKIPITLRPGGELSLTPDVPEYARQDLLPTYGHNTKFVLADIWVDKWPDWATRAVEWLSAHDYTLILAHPERMSAVRTDAGLMDELTRMGVRFQGNLGPLGGSESPQSQALAERFLKEGRYFMLGSDSHRKDGMAVRLAGLKRAEELVDAATLTMLTETNPGQLWK